MENELFDKVPRYLKKNCCPSYSKSGSCLFHKDHDNETSRPLLSKTFK